MVYVSSLILLDKHNLILLDVAELPSKTSPAQRVSAILHQAKLDKCTFGIWTQIL